MFQFRKHCVVCSGSARSGPEALPSAGVEAQFADFTSEAPTNSMAWILQTASWAERVFVHTFPERSAAIWGVSPPTQKKKQRAKKISLHRCSSVTCFNENIQYLPPAKAIACCCFLCVYAKTTQCTCTQLLTSFKYPAILDAQYFRISGVQ